MKQGQLPLGNRQKGIWDAELDFLPECMYRVPLPELLSLARARIVETAMSPIRVGSIRMCLKYLGMDSVQSTVIQCAYAKENGIGL